MVWTRVQWGIAALALAAVTAWSASAQAGVFGFEDIDQWVGSGANEAALVIDWNDGKAPTLPGGESHSLVWGYRWDGSATAEDMFVSVISNISTLYAKIGTEGDYGVPLYGIGYDADGDGFGIDDGTTFDSDGLVVTGPSDNASPTDVDDRYEEGWFYEGFWFHYVSSGGNPYGGGSWAEGRGLSSQTLSDGDWTGLSYAPGFAGTTPSAPVPEPASLVLLGLGGGLMLLRRRGPVH